MGDRIAEIGDLPPDDFTDSATRNITAVTGSGTGGVNGKELYHAIMTVGDDRDNESVGYSDETDRDGASHPRATGRGSSKSYRRSRRTAARPGSRRSPTSPSPAPSHRPSGSARP